MGRPSAWLRVAIACGLVLVSSAALVARPSAAAPPATPGKRPVVMVLYFDNNTGDPSFDFLAKGLADMMITDLSQIATLSVVERDKLEALLHELKLQRTRYFDPKTAQRIGAGVGAEYAVTGAFLSMKPSIRIDVRLIRIASGEVLKATQVTGQVDDFFALQQRLTAALVNGLPLALSATD